ncbi:hypothetical protein INR49_026886 [Caranx melampygus]|nr:hypothetical protein INR49_026886 [Caranx melampygus]
MFSSSFRQGRAELSERQSGKTKKESLFGGERCSSERIELHRLRWRLLLLLLRSTVDDQFCEGHRPKSAVKRTRPGLAVGCANVSLTVIEALILAVSASVLRVESHGDINTDVLLRVGGAEELVAALRVSPADLLVSADSLGCAVGRLVGLAPPGGRTVVSFAIAAARRGLLLGFPLA